MGKQDGTSRHVTRPGVDDSTATILHVDMDAFFASVELLDHPELVGRPVIVGHRSARSIVTAATYEARKFGVNSALPMAIALRRCPDAIVLEPHFDRYQHFSSMVMEIFDEVTPLVERLGIDEAFLDVAGARTVFGSPLRVAELIRSRVRAETGLVCSVGAASTKFVAKLASGLSKPDGLLVVPADETVELLHPLPISKLWGVGGKTEEVLRGRGLHTIGDVARASRETLVRAVGEAGADRLHDLSWGIDPRRVHTRAEEKSVGHEMTFETDITDPSVIRTELLRMSNMVAVRLRKAGLVGRTVVLKLRFGDFTTITRSKTIGEPTDLGRRIYEEVREVYEALGKQDAPIRLVGVRAEQLQETATTQFGLWDESEGWREAEDVMDAASAKFGRGAVKPARLLGHNGYERPRMGQRD
ncbi:MAG: DNA polymerase IV [Micrococcales bacterium 70-64]|nr:DNA polymerase IV [Leifsonia sp.]ODU65194.1 MAG: DNA polymerase IV [Leifsonia sp. SCN 70-46]OJX86886.1 MAG: DNA polymerase IV [Micrococcales bacterium 70-64]